MYEAALIDPKTLVKVVKEADGDAQIEGFEYVATQAWEEKSGKDPDDFPRHDIEYRSDPAGEQWAEESVEALFPKLSKKFG